MVTRSQALPLNFCVLYPSLTLCGIPVALRSKQRLPTWAVGLVLLCGALLCLGCKEVLKHLS